MASRLMETEEEMACRPGHGAPAKNCQAIRGGILSKGTVRRQGRLFANGKGLWWDFTIPGAGKLRTGRFAGVDLFRENAHTADPAVAEERMLDRIKEVRRGVVENPHGTPFADLEQG